MGSTKSTKVFVVTLTAVVAALVGSVRSADNFRVLHAFTNGADGGSSWAGLIIDAQGHLYGTTSVGGAFVAGTVFKLSPGLNGKWSETVLHSFQPNSPDGAFPKSRLVFD